MRIRIGNDIKLKLSLNSKNSGDVNIISANVYIINRTAKEQALKALQAKTKFLSRFPAGRDFIEPKLNGFEPTEYNINIAWDMPYHCYPHQHRVANYHGFGVYPNWDEKFTPMVDNCDLTSYSPEVKFTENRGVIEVVFPAESQLYTGDYDIVVVAKLYNEGYKNNLTTITTDYSNAFTLIPKNETADTDDSGIVLNYAISNPTDKVVNDEYVEGMNYNEETGDLTLSMHSGKNLTTTITGGAGVAKYWYE